MLAYVYTAKTAEGKLVSGELNAENTEQVVQRLADAKLFPVKIDPKGGHGGSKGEFNFFNKIPLKQKMMAVKQLSTLIRAGLPIVQAITVLIEQIEHQKLKQVFVDVLGDVEGGSSLYDAFSKQENFFGVAELSLIKAGEESGTLEKVLNRMAIKLEKDQALQSKLRSAMIYPSFVLVIVIGVIAVMLMYVMPKMASLYSDFKGELPATTRLMMGLSGFLIHSWWLILLGIIFIAMAFTSFLKTPNGRDTWDKFIITLPGIGNLVKMVVMARFTRTLGTLMGSGVPVLDSLSISAKASGNTYYEREIELAAEGVKGGKNLSEPLMTNPNFPSMVGHMISVGEQTGEIDHMLEGLANYYEEEVDNIIKGLSTLIEPLIIVGLGGVVLLILVAIMQPIYSLSDAMYKH